MLVVFGGIQSLNRVATPNEIYEVTVELIDDTGAPFVQPWNYNTQIALALYY